MKIHVTHEDLRLMIYGLKNTRYAYGKQYGYVDELKDRLARIERGQ